MNKVLSLVFLCCVFACQQKAEKLPVQKEQNLEEIDQEDVTTISSITTDYDTLINRVKKRGDVDAYDELFYSFQDCCFSARTDSVMVYAKIMAEKFNYDRAYYHYYDAVLEKNGIDYSSFPQIDISKMKKPEKQKLENWFKFMLERKQIKQETLDSIKK
ncbi:hypothetical protein HNP37_001330 [Flavobacterium nitrogenifigens]|uniref:DUF4296 domain-containing protein n=2 Tax=Flavobacterium TaxID=237 RepID=A0A7W7IVE6_9FLAO|nr:MULTISPECIES: hypothetical protein [Flavobacterium]MBB4801291.1 hypothetical protein [Flavobacterium nitrogenifigens]MBB6384961.1 hypothetical protein [Flavobacterium notoginsengisoli]